MIKSIALVLTAALVAAPAFASPSSCPAGQSALAQKWYTSNYCRMAACHPYIRDVTFQACVPCSGTGCLTNPLGTCYSAHYQSRPLGAPGPSSWASLPACPVEIDAAF